MSPTAQQHICSLHGWLTILQPVPGDYAIIIHADKDCANLLHKTKYPYASWADRIFCTNLEDPDVITGHSLPKLEACIRAVAAEQHPRFIIILGSCISQLIHDNLEGLLSKLNRTLKIPLIYKNTSGFSFKDPLEIIDDCGSLLIGQAPKVQRSSKEKSCVNLIGFDYDAGAMKPDRRSIISSGLQELVDDLESCAHITLNTVLNPFMPLDAWLAAPHAALTCTPDSKLYPQVALTLQKEHDVPVKEIPFPVGLQATEAFYQAIIDHFKLDTSLIKKILGKKLTAAYKTLERYKKRFKGRKFYYNIGSSVDFSIMNSAKEGTLYLDLFRECGFDIELLVQGNPEPENTRRVGQLLRGIGIQEKITMFGHCGDAHKIFAPYQGSVVFGSPLLRDQAAASGHAFLEVFDIELGIGHHAKTLSRIAKRLEAC